MVVRAELAKRGQVGADYYVLWMLRFAEQTTGWDDAELRIVEKDNQLRFMFLPSAPAALPPFDVTLPMTDSGYDGIRDLAAHGHLAGEETTVID
jgi:hypothetical protein